MAPQRRWLPIAVLSFASLLALVTALRTPVQFPMPNYFKQLQIWAAQGSIPDTFTPLAYPLFAAPAYRIGGTLAISLLQAILFVDLVYLALRILIRLHLPPATAALGSLLILLYPEYLLSVPKIWDVDLSAFLLLLFVLLCLRLLTEGPSLTINLALGLTFGAGIFCRPNYSFLVCAFVYCLAKTHTPTPRRPKALSFAAVSIVTVISFMLLGLISHGAPFFPRNGPYNLFVGNNAYAAHAMLDDLNAEPSLGRAIIHTHPSPLPSLENTSIYGTSIEPFYTQQSIVFAVHHPGEEVELVAVKLFTLFRPDTKVHPLRSGQGLVKLLLALPAPILLLLLLLPGRPPLDRADRLLLLVYAAYVLPFLITNSDPRFRIPLDGLLLLHIVRLLYLRRHGSISVTPGIPAHAG